MPRQVAPEVASEIAPPARRASLHALALPPPLPPSPIPRPPPPTPTARRAGKGIYLDLDPEEQQARRDEVHAEIAECEDEGHDFEGASKAARQIMGKRDAGRSLDRPRLPHRLTPSLLPLSPSHLDRGHPSSSGPLTTLLTRRRTRARAGKRAGKLQTHGRKGKFLAEATIGGVPVRATISWPLRSQHKHTTTPHLCKPKQLSFQLPANKKFANPGGKAGYKSVTIPLGGLVQQPDGSWELRLGAHECRSPLDASTTITVEVQAI